MSVSKKHWRWFANEIAAEFPPKECNCRHELITMVLEFGAEFGNFSEGMFFEYLHKQDAKVAAGDRS